MIIVGVISSRNYKKVYDWDHFGAITIRIAMIGVTFLATIIRMIMVGMLDRL